MSGRAKAPTASSCDSARAAALAFVLFGFHRIAAHRFCLMGKTETASFFFSLVISALPIITGSVIAADHNRHHFFNPHPAVQSVFHFLKLHRFLCRLTRADSDRHIPCSVLCHRVRETFASAGSRYARSLPFGRSSRFISAWNAHSVCTELS